MAADVPAQPPGSHHMEFVAGMTQQQRRSTVTQAEVFVQEQLLDEAVLPIHNDRMLLRFRESGVCQSSSHSDKAFLTHQWSEGSQSAGGS